NLQITQNGLLSFSYSANGGAYTNVISSQSISASNGALPATLRFGFAGSTGGDTNIHEILCFKAAPSAVSSSSASVNEKQTSQVQTTSQAYFAFYNPNDWTGRVTAYGLLVDPRGKVSIQSVANWDTECVLTGVPSGQTCLYTGHPVRMGEFDRRRAERARSDQSEPGLHGSIELSARRTHQRDQQSRGRGVSRTRRSAGRYRRCQPNVGRAAGLTVS